MPGLPETFDRSAFMPGVFIRRVAAQAFLAVVLAAGAWNAQAQNALIHHQVIKQHLSPPAMGREFWWAQPSNYWGEDLGGKYIRIYITSPQNTTAYVSIGTGGQTAPVTIQAYKIGTYIVPLGWEMESSGIVEPKAIHVWSNTADLTVYVMSHNAYTSDGSYIVPTVGWGTDYVVAGYGALFEGFGSFVYDLPSEFTVTADVDNTVVTITPSCDLRQCYGQGDNPTVVAYPQGKPFTITLNRGECAQFLSVQATGSDGFDVTGTIVHSNNPVGVLGGSGCPNIPADFPYCDHVEDMVPPVRTWAETYYTTNFIAPPGYPNHDFGLYLFISSKAGQVIHRQDYITGQHVECIIDNQYGTYWDELESAQKFWSDAPFLLVEYINSASYPDNAGLYVQIPGDPAEVVINPREQYTKTVVFQTPVSVGAQLPYKSYASIIVNKNDEKTTTFDKQKILSWTHQPIDDTFDIFTVTNIAPGSHIVTGDTSGVGVYVYGYGNDESYAWAGSFGTGTFHAQDTVPPVVDTTGSCYDAAVHLYDYGTNPGGIPQSMLGDIRLDSDYNMAYQLDPNWQEGLGIDSTYYDMFVVDRSKPAYLKVEGYDVAGNQTTVISTYTPQTAYIAPPVQNFGSVITPTIKYLYDTLVNTGVVPYNFDQLKLLYGNLGFTIDSGMTPSVLDTGEHRILKIAFKAVKTNSVVDSIIFGNECGLQSVALVGSGGAADFLVTDQHWPNELVPPPAGGYVKTVQVDNLSSIPITIDSGWWPDKVHFVAVDTFPFTVPATNTQTGKQGVVPFRIAYFPDKNSLTKPDTTQGSWTSPDVENGKGIRNDQLTGYGVAPSETFIQDIDTTIECVNPGDTMHLVFTIAEGNSTNGIINRVYHADTTDFINLQGVLSSGTQWNPETNSQPFAPGETATISLDYVPPVGTNVTVHDSLVAINSEQDTVMGHPIRITVHVVYRAQQIQPASPLILPTVRYQQGQPASRQFVITNSTSAPLAISGITLSTGGAYNGAYTITTNPAMPDTLQAGQFMTVTVTFNDSMSFDPLQTAQLVINSDACNLATMNVVDSVTTSGAAITGYVPSPILSCDQATNNVIVHNTQPFDSVKHTYIVDYIDSVIWIGPDNGASFSIPNIIGDSILSGQSFTIPVTFIPTQAKGLDTVTDLLKIVLHSSRSDTVLLQSVSGISGSALVTATSQFAQPTAAASDMVQVPATININKFGLALPTDTMHITGIQLTYTIPHPDLLIPQTPNPFTMSQALQALGWTATLVPNPPGVRNDSLIVVKLAGTKELTSAFDASMVGQLNFQVALDKSDQTTPVTLQSIQLFTGANAQTPIGSCIDTATQSGNFALILRCGDSTLQSVMATGAAPLVILPATPDPVTGPSVTFKYATEGEKTMTLAVYDLLGHEVARPVDHVPQDAGAWQVSCNTAGLPNGTYTYRLSAQGAFGATVRSGQFVIQR